MAAQPRRRSPQGAGGRQVTGWYRRNSWWLPNAAAVVAGVGRITEAAVSGAKVSPGELILWVTIGTFWAVGQFMTEWQGRRAGRQIRGALNDIRKTIGRPAKP